MGYTGLAQMLPRSARRVFASPQAHTGENGEDGIQVTIRHILDGSEESEPLLIEHETQTRD